jgi:uncharacterized repeat protein (TIGR01451 family)
VALSKQVSKTTAQSGDILNYTINLNVSGGSATHVVVSDTLPAYMTFAGFGSMPGGTNPTFVPALSLLTWQLPSPLAPGSYQLAYQTQVQDFVPSGTLVINNAQLSYTGLGAPLSTSVSVTVTGQFTVKIGVYNEAGELVKEILLQQFSQPLNNISLQAGTSITSLQGANSAVSIYYGTHFIGSWDGTGGSGNLVTNGTYYIKVDNVDSFGVVKSVVQSVTVTRSLETVSVRIYNEAGEVVRNLTTLVSDPQNNMVTSAQLTSPVIQPGSALLGQLGINLNNGVTLTWDGRSDGGQVVTNGRYYIEIRSTDGKGGETVINRDVVVENGHSTTNNFVWAYPNPAVDGAGPVTFTVNSPTPQTLSVMVYDVAGERITTVAGQAGTSQAVWNPNGLSSGVYIAVAEALESATGHFTVRQTLKVLIKH